jgi:hypothetical protein
MQTWLRMRFASKNYIGSIIVRIWFADQVVVAAKRFSLVIPNFFIIPNYRQVRGGRLTFVESSASDVLLLSSSSCPASSELLPPAARSNA